MSDQTNQNAPAAPTFKIIEPQDGVPRIYAAFSHLTWTGPDLTIDLYQLEQPNREIQDQNTPNSLLNTGRVTMTWQAAKMFHQTLSNVLSRYEAVNGPITTEFKQI